MFSADHTEANIESGHGSLPMPATEFLIMECPVCKRIMADVSREDTDPPRAVRVMLVCPDCDDGDRHCPEYLDADGQGVMWFEGLDPAIGGGADGQGPIAAQTADDASGMTSKLNPSKGEGE